MKQMFKDSTRQRDIAESQIGMKAPDNIRSVSSIPTPTVAKRRKALSQQLEYPGDFDALVDMLSQPDVYDPAAKDMFGLAAIHKFSAWNKPDFLAVLCDKLTVEELNMRGGDNGFSCLHFCIEMGAFQSLKFLMTLRSKIDVDGKDKNEMSPLELARTTGNTTAEEILLIREYTSHTST